MNKRGITLIALIIAIIVLLILAGVTINLALGDSGILGKTKQATDAYQVAKQDEEKKLDEYSNIIDVTTNRNEIKLSEDKIREMIREEIAKISPYPLGTINVLDSNFAGTNEKTKIAQDDGWVKLSALPTGAGSKWYILQIGNLAETGGCSNAYQGYEVCLPCKKGQTIKYMIWGSNVSGKLEFIPMSD